MPLEFELLKPQLGEPCNGCGYCCTVQPCQLAQEFLSCSQGPCIALERSGERATCGLVRNPLGYLYAAAHPREGLEPSKEEAPNLEASRALSSRIASALGIGRGCDSDDDEASHEWNLVRMATDRPQQ